MALVRTLSTRDSQELMPHRARPIHVAGTSLATKKYASDTKSGLSLNWDSRPATAENRTAIKNQRQHGTVVAPPNIDQIAEAMEPRSPLTSSPTHNIPNEETTTYVKRKMPWKGKARVKVKEKPPNCYSFTDSARKPRVVYVRRSSEVDYLLQGLSGYVLVRRCVIGTHR